MNFEVQKQQVLAIFINEKENCHFFSCLNKNCKAAGHQGEKSIVALLVTRAKNLLSPCWSPGRQFYCRPATIHFSSRQLKKRQLLPYSCYATKSKNNYLFEYKLVIQVIGVSNFSEDSLPFLCKNYANIILGTALGTKRVFGLVNLGLNYCLVWCTAR